ncbi:unnamed protein product [Malus baccata var. baccata]
MFNDLLDWLKIERELLVSVAKLERTLRRPASRKLSAEEVDEDIRSLIPVLIRTFVLLYYLYGHVRDIEVDVRGGVCCCGSENDFRLCMGRIVTLDEEDMVWSGVRQLDRALGLFQVCMGNSRDGRSFATARPYMVCRG